jgi:hypothetical protein
VKKIMIVNIEAALGFSLSEVAPRLEAADKQEFASSMREGDRGNMWLYGTLTHFHELPFQERHHAAMIATEVAGLFEQFPIPGWGSLDEKGMKILDRCHFLQNRIVEQKASPEACMRMLLVFIRDQYNR